MSWIENKSDTMYILGQGQVFVQTERRQQEQGLKETFTQTADILSCDSGKSTLVTNIISNGSTTLRCTSKVVKLWLYVQ